MIRSRVPSSFGLKFTYYITIAHLRAAPGIKKLEARTMSSQSIPRRRPGNATPNAVGGGDAVPKSLLYSGQGLTSRKHTPLLKSKARSGKGLFTGMLVAAVYLTLLISKMSSTSSPAKSFQGKEELSVSEHFLTTVSKEQTYTSDCKLRYLNNRTWGQSVARFVDKVTAKEVVREFNVPDLKIVPTIAFYDQSNFSSFTIDVFLKLASGSGAIIKPSHSSGGVALAYNDTYHCFKKCRRLDNFTARNKQPQHQKMRISENEVGAFNVARKVMDIELTNDYLKADVETQYQFIPKGIIVEERLHVEDMMEYHWWVVNGRPVFVCLRCNHNGVNAGSYFTSRFRRLDIKMEGLPACRADMQQPKTWRRMVQMVTALSLKLPKGIIRIDLYASDRDIYFSEFTYTSNGCRYYYDPLVADAFLYGALYQIFKPNQLTPTFIEAAINQRFWYIIPFMQHPNVDDKKIHNALWQMNLITAHPNDWTTCRRAKFHVTSNETSQCMTAVSELDKRYPIRCIGVSSDALVVLGLTRIPSFRETMQRVDWQWAGAVLLVLLILVAMGCGSEEKEWQIGAVLVYLAAVTLYKYVQPNSLGLFSPDSLWRTAMDSCYAFVSVHPMTSQWLGWMHVATYWFQIAAWKSKTIRGVLFWYFLYESVASFANEFMHLTEEDRQVRCLRVTYVHLARRFAVNDVVRAYLLPPFLVYLYLLPKLLLQWTPYGEMF